MRQVIVSADDFGLSEEVNEAIEKAHRDGVLATASLMVAGPAAADAVRRAHRLPDLNVGLHCVLIEGEAMLPHRAIAPITQVDADGKAFFDGEQAAAGVRYFFHPRARRALQREITAQFRAFTATGLRLDHANAHKHMHLHPTVGRLLVSIGAEYGLRYVRTPLEPYAPVAAVEPFADSWGAWALRHWCKMLKWQIRRAGMRTNDWCFGLRWSGAMTTSRISALMAHLPDGLSEIYFHPATAQNARLSSVMPGYGHAAELQTLLAPEVADAIAQNRIKPATWRNSETCFKPICRF